jgi:hypothetical protein
MIFVDSCIPMYLVGASHPNKSRVLQLVTQLLTGTEVLVTSAEVFQEILHRYRALGDALSLGRAYDALEDLAERIVDVTKEDVDQARLLLAEYSGLSSRDCIHAAVMRRLKCHRVWTFDQGFKRVSGLELIC